MNYLFGAQGTAAIFILDLEEIGFPIAHHDIIIASHAAVCNNWMHSKGEGPFLMRISDDSFTAPLLDPTSFNEIVQWYDGLVNKLRPLNVALMPFDSIIPRMGAEGLCPPGMGTVKYADMATALFTFLARVLPSDDADCQWLVGVSQSSTQDGYEIIRSLFGKYVPGFSDTAINEYPLYKTTQSITGFASAVLLFYRIGRKCGHVESSIAMSRKFLSLIEHPLAHSLIPYFQEKVNACTHYAEWDEPAIVTPDLTIASLAERLDEAVRRSARAQEDSYPVDNRVHGRVRALEVQLHAMSRGQVNTTAMELGDAIDDLWSPPGTIVNHVQGFLDSQTTPSVNYLDRNRSRTSNDRSTDRRSDSRISDRRQPSSDRGRSTDTRQRSSSRTPRRTGRPAFLEGVRCDACGTDGHKASTCVLTGRVVTIMKYFKSKPDLCRIIANKWTSRDDMQRTINTVQGYMDENSFTVDHLEAEMDVELDDILGLDDDDACE